jgi:two-component system, OmpR family, phosphate regulon response regulator PhoB
MRTVVPSARVLVVDDDADLRSVAVFALEAEGLGVFEAGSGMEAFEILANDSFDLVILDVMMPAISGLEVLQDLRNRNPTAAVMILSGLGSEENRVRGLQLGADDYVTKPYSTRELVARAQALLRRTAALASLRTIELDGFVVDLDAREVWIRGAFVETTAKEFDLLAFLAAHPGRVYTRQQLLREVWQSSSEWQQDGTVTEHIRRLRLKIEENPVVPRWLHTIRGVGYRFERRAEARPITISEG